MILQICWHENAPRKIEFSVNYKGGERAYPSGARKGMCISIDKKFHIYE